MIEETAKTKWCPFARVFYQYANVPVAINRTFKGNADENCHCLASECMAWRWSDEKSGYCGLAGKDGAP